MTKTYLYIPEELNSDIMLLVQQRKESKASILREAIEKGLESMKPKKNNSVEFLHRLGELGKKYNVNGPKDSSTNFDKHLWDNYEV